MKPHERFAIAFLCILVVAAVLGLLWLGREYQIGVIQDALKP